MNGQPIPVVACRVSAMPFNQAGYMWSYSWAYFHLFPWFGRIEPGQSVTVRGRLYVLKGGAQDALRVCAKTLSVPP